MRPQQQHRTLPRMTTRFRSILSKRLILLTLASAVCEVYSSRSCAISPVKESIRGRLALNASRSYEVAERCLQGAILLAFIPDSIESIRLDEWSVIRGCGRISSEIEGKRRRAAQVGKMLGGYTPRIVFLAGVMLRSLQCATNIKYFFDPSLGFAAGTAVAATFAKREWLKCMLLGWGYGGVHWRAFRVRPPRTENDNNGT